MSDSAQRAELARAWGVRDALVVTSLRGLDLAMPANLRFAGRGVRVEVTGQRGPDTLVTIEIAPDAPLGPRDLLVEHVGVAHRYAGMFTVVADRSPAGPGSRGIGSHLL